MATEGLPIQVCCRIMDVSESGFYAWRNRPPSARTLRHAWLTDEIRQVHAASNSVYGGRRVHAELTLGRGIAVGHGAVAMPMHRAGIKGLPGNKRRRPVHQTPTAADLVERQFTRGAPNELWVTDITEHPTREGKVYCCVARGRLLPPGGGVVHRCRSDRHAGTAFVDLDSFGPARGRS
ncbi:IS3 family transposase [Streptosporangium sp. G11]|uniref:IS3 family transposase n=1 Tax=Streptosporangium sp. G11 TaxID=3436926 RepID=UPI003EB82EE2